MFSKFFFQLFLVLLSALTDTTNASPGKIGNSNRSICNNYISWTAEEDAKLLELYEIHKYNSRKWEKISRILKRDLRCTREHFEIKLDPRLKNPKVEWTTEENELVWEEIKVSEALNIRPRWAEIARQIDKSPKRVFLQSEKIRKGQVQVDTSLNTTNKSINLGSNNIRRKWTAEEDKIVREVYEKYNGGSALWNELSVILKRDPRCIRDHYINKLDPNIEISRSKWTNEENRIILEELHNAKSMDRKPMWLKIAQQLKRSPKSVYFHRKKLLKNLKSNLDKFESSKSLKSNLDKFESLKSNLDKFESSESLKSNLDKFESLKSNLKSSVGFVHIPRKKRSKKVPQKSESRESSTVPLNLDNDKSQVSSRINVLDEEKMAIDALLKLGS